MWHYPDLPVSLLKSFFPANIKIIYTNKNCRCQVQSGWTSHTEVSILKGRDFKSCHAHLTFSCMTFLAPKIMKFSKRQQHFFMFLYELIPLGNENVLMGTVSGSCLIWYKRATYIYENNWIYFAYNITITCCINKIWWNNLQILLTKFTGKADRGFQCTFVTIVWNTFKFFYICWRQGRFYCSFNYDLQVDLRWLPFFGQYLSIS